MYVFDGKNLISIFGIPYFPVLPFGPCFQRAGGGWHLWGRGDT